MWECPPLPLFPLSRGDLLGKRAGPPSNTQSYLMASMGTQHEWFIDKSTNKIYKVVWVNGRVVMLESDDSVRILTPTKILKTFYKPLDSIRSSKAT